MRKTLLLENLNTKIQENVSFRRYSLSDIISESYKTYYESADDSNFKKLVEAHISDIRNNPSDTDRLSRQLCSIKHIASMLESKKMKDEELLVPEEDWSKVTPDEKIEESKKSRTWGDWQREKGNPCRVKYYTENQDMTNEVIGVIYEPASGETSPGYDTYGAEIYDNREAAAILNAPEGFDTEEGAIKWVEEWFSQNLEESSHDEDVEEKEDEDLLEDTELTDEEVAELAKHLEEIRKNKKVNECDDTPKEEVKESKGRKLKRRVNEAEDDFYTPTQEEADKVASHIKKKYGNKIGEQDYIDTLSNIIKHDNISTDIIDQACEKAGIEISESKTWNDISLKEFSEKSASKAFVKTFKKLDKKLKEGTALTRQESVNLYKAANSAMTHLSVELEHNPEFLTTFRESTSLLAKDVNALLECMKNGKAPSKATMKSLAKFSEALLLEAGEDEEDLPPIEDEDEDDFADEESIPSGDPDVEETEEFEQEYADARVELHKELADEFADTENPEVQERLAQDAEEVINLPGVTEEQVAEIAEEIPTEETESAEDIESEDVEPQEDEVEESVSSKEDDITEDELAELKKHLMEMRKAKK